MADTILPQALPTALGRYPDVTTLSLDCFDTLLWRDTHAPRDLFGLLPAITVPQRQWAEQRARTASLVKRHRAEVSIGEIYAELYPNATAAERDAAIQHELDAEALHCFAFAPTVALMREAKRRGLRVIIVSDTYLDEAQLRALIAAAAGADVAALIDQLFCSSVHGASKSEGLYKHVLKKLRIAPDKILHIGDNPNADVAGVEPFGVHTLHLHQFSDATEQRLRLEAAVGTMLHPTEALAATNFQPHRATLAAVEPLIEDPAEALGFSVLGPVLHGFDRWLADEAEALRARHGGTVHCLFLMRDGHLPMRVHAASGRESPAHAIEISRFTATAAAFDSPKAITRYLQHEVGTDMKVVAKQLLLTQAEIGALMKQLPQKGTLGAFLAAVSSPARVRQTIARSTAFAERLAQHVRATVAPAPGDTLMLVDLGYNGSVQNEIEPVLRRLLGVEVAGRYLLLREQYQTGFDKKGLIDPTHYDAHTLESMCANVAVLEQVCTAAQGSVVDYAADGTPLRRANSIKGRQSEVRERIQAGCIRFEQAQRDGILRASAPDAAVMWRRNAAATLARLMFLPLPQELDVIAAFEHDVNLGVDDVVPLFDTDIAQRGLRQRGLFYMKGSERMYLPAELHGEGLALKLTLLAHKRFGLALKYADFIDRTIALPVIVADGTNVTTSTVTATPTHDGYYMAPIPIGDCRYSVALQFGQIYEWLQIDSAVFMPTVDFLSETPRRDVERDATLSLEDMTQAAPHLFQCENAFGFMMVPPPPRESDEQMMLAVTFRPIVARAAADAVAAPVATVQAARQ
ncbi:HAD family hydrolase [Sphingomonas sp. CJ20]